MDGYHPFLDISEAQTYVDYIQTFKWWPLDVVIKVRRGYTQGAESGVEKKPWGFLITLGTGDATEGMVIHELGHIIAWHEADKKHHEHGKEFIRATLLIMKNMTRDVRFRLYVDALREAGVPVDECLP
jgi:hypothetical protein